jgi:peptide/nickel transport system ATP-binding protein
MNETVQRPLLAVRDLTIDFRIDDATTLRAVDGVSFDVPENATVGLVGESGSGKSVTALSIMGLLPRNASLGQGSRTLYEGSNLLELRGRRLQQMRGRDISMIFQEPMSSLNPVFTIGFQLTEVLTRHMGLSRRQARARAIELLREVEIAEPQSRIDSYPFELSGGQQQRAMIAMALACGPRLLIADEPTTALDVTVQKQILELLARLQREHRMSMLFITHDLGLIGQIAQRVIVMRAGAVREQGAVGTVFSAPHDAYTRALLACRPQIARRPSRLPVVEDFLEPPSAAPERSERTRGLTGAEPIVLEARGLSKTFHLREGLLRRRPIAAVKDVSFKLARGKTLGVVGESGSGKTTLALMLVRLQPATAGEVLFEGTEVLGARGGVSAHLKRRIQIVFQNPYASLNPRFTAGQILMEPMHIHGIGASERERTALAYELLERVGLPRAGFFKYPHEFSGGQRQRIAIARCLAIRPDVLICDESVSAVDVSIQAHLLNLLQDLQDQYGMSYIFISHDLAVVKYISDEVMVMKDGEIVEIGNSDEVYARPRHPYTKELLASVPRGPVTALE